MSKLIKTKTFWMGITTIVTAIAGYCVGEIDVTAMVAAILGGLTTICVRDAVQKGINK